MNQFTHHPSEVSNLPLLLTSHVLGFEASAEYHELADYELGVRPRINEQRYIL
jgi:hypothetical protein